MENLNNLQFIENEDNNNIDVNNNNLDQNDNNVIFTSPELESDDYLIIFFNSIPSFIYIIIISIILYNILKTEDDIFILKYIKNYLIVLLIIYNLYIIKSIFYYYNTIKFEIENTYYQILISLSYLTLDISYYISTFFGYKIYQELSFEYIINNLYKCIFIYSLLIIGIVHFCLFILRIVYVIIFYFLSISAFIENEREFIIKQGELPVILDKFLIHQKADLKHCKECIICIEDIKEGQDIICLKCSNLHFFHSKCIRKWLRNNISCPICRQQNIF